MLLMQTKEDYEHNLNIYIDNNNFKKYKTNITMLRLGHSQILTIGFITDHPQTLAERLQLKSAFTKTYSLTYNDKKQTLSYTNSINKHKGMQVSDSNWGNLIKACTDLHDFDWIIQNDKANHVLAIDPDNFYEMQYILQIVLDYFAKQKQQTS